MSIIPRDLLVVGKIRHLKSEAQLIRDGGGKINVRESLSLVK